MTIVVTTYYKYFTNPDIKKCGLPKRWLQKSDFTRKFGNQLVVIFSCGIRQLNPFWGKIIAYSQST
jgi:hypothetical protein